MALYVFVGYRLMPSFQQIYQASTQLRFVGPMLNTLHQDFMSLHSDENYQHATKLKPLAEAIRLNNVTYRYPDALQLALKKIDLTIPVHTTVGFVGATGSGKTSAVDLILGLLEPQEGSLTVDGQEITSLNRRQWQKVIGYVPQHIYLADDTVAANIAFGLNKGDIDQKSVERAATIANLHQFVTSDLPKGYSTLVGERGVRLSGGQRQRIGIARALYHSPEVLILDEATSALDNLTEQAVMEAVSTLRHQITIIVIAHRLTTVRHCDQIYLLERGELKASGTYEKLSISSHQFAAMVNNA